MPQRDYFEELGLVGPTGCSVEKESLEVGPTVAPDIDQMVMNLPTLVQQDLQVGLEGYMRRNSCKSLH